MSGTSFELEQNCSAHIEWYSIVTYLGKTHLLSKSWIKHNLSYFYDICKACAAHDKFFTFHDQDNYIV